MMSVQSVGTKRVRAVWSIHLEVRLPLRNSCTDIELVSAFNRDMLLHEP